MVLFLLYECVFDDFVGMSLHVRDVALDLDDQMPTSDVNRQYFAQNAEILVFSRPGII